MDLGTSQSRIGHAVGRDHRMSRVLHERRLRPARIGALPGEERGQHPRQELHRVRGVIDRFLGGGIRADVRGRQPVPGPHRLVPGRGRQQPGHGRGLPGRLHRAQLDGRSPRREVLLPACLRGHRGHHRERGGGGEDQVPELHPLLFRARRRDLPDRRPLGVGRRLARGRRASRTSRAPPSCTRSGAGAP